MTLHFIGCKRSSSEPVNSSGDSTAVHKETAVIYQAGDRDDKGRLVVYAVGDLYQFLGSDAALVFRNIGTETIPKAQYDLTTRTHGYQAYSSLNGLVKALERMTEPRIVDFYRTCGAPPWYGLPEKEVDAFYHEMEELGVELRNQGENGFINIICTCPQSGK